MGSMGDQNSPNRKLASWVLKHRAQSREPRERIVVPSGQPKTHQPTTDNWKPSNQSTLQIGILSLEALSAAVRERDNRMTNWQLTSRPTDNSKRTNSSNWPLDLKSIITITTFFVATYHCKGIQPLWQCFNSKRYFQRKGQTLQEFQQK